MRNALILLAVVALLIVAVGALNNGTAFDVDYVAGTVSAVSLVWVAAVIALIVFVVGLIAAYLAQMAVFGQRRKLEAELQSTYERLRQAEALAARPAPAPEPAPVAAAVVPTVVAAEAETAADAGDATSAAGEAETAIIREDATLAVGDEATVVAGRPAPEPEPGADGAAPAEHTAVTVADSPAGGDAPTAAGDEARPSGS